MQLCMYRQAFGVLLLALIYKQPALRFGKYELIVIEILYYIQWLR